MEPNQNTNMQDVASDSSHPVFLWTDVCSFGKMLYLCMIE